MEYDWATSALHKSYCSSLCGGRRRRLCERESLQSSCHMSSQLSTVHFERWYGLGKLLGEVKRSSRFESWPRDVAERWRRSELVSICWRSTSPASSLWWVLPLFDRLRTRVVVHVHVGLTFIFSLYHLMHGIHLLFIKVSILIRAGTKNLSTAMQVEKKKIGNVVMLSKAKEVHV